MAVNQSQVALDIRQAVKMYSGKVVLNELSLRAYTGECTTILGPNGAGKTTLIECCEGLRKLDQGAIRVLGENPNGAGPALHARIGVMLQDSGLPTSAKALEILGHISRMYKHPLDYRALAERLEITSFASTTVRRLSGGQRQRLALACALVGQPELVFLDEPTAGMDIESRANVWQLVEELKASGVSVILTTHDMNEAMRLSDQIAIMDQGQVIAKDTPKNLVAAHAGPEQRVTLTFSRPIDPLPEVLAPLGESPQQSESPRPDTAGTPATYLLREPATNSLLAQILSAAEASSAQLLDLSSATATLEDVFLQMTGKKLK